MEGSICFTRPYCTNCSRCSIEFICRYGTPYRIHTDQGREFESQLFSEMCTKLDIYKTHTTPYRPQSDGMVERFNPNLQQMFSLFVNKHRTDWDDHLPYVMMAYRAAIHDSTKCLPNLLILGRETEFPIDIIAGHPPNYEEDICINKYVEFVKEAGLLHFNMLENVFKTVSLDRKNIMMKISK